MCVILHVSWNARDGLQKKNHPAHAIVQLLLFLYTYYFQAKDRDKEARKEI